MNYPGGRTECRPENRFTLHDLWLCAWRMNVNEGFNELVAVMLLTVCTV